jgi:tetratricopeptide (TPR) repeat protein
MRGFLILLFAGVFSSTSGVADIRDLRDLSDGNNAALFIGFDDVPELLSSQIGERLIELEFSGSGPIGTRRIEVASGLAVSALEVLRNDTSQRMRVELSASADGFEITPTETGYMLRWQIVASATTIAISATETAAPTAQMIATENPEANHTAIRDSNTTDIAESGSPSGFVALGSADECSAAQAAVEVDAWDIDALAVHSECLLENGDASQAIVLLERVIAFEPGRFEAVLTLAEAHETLGDLETARGLYDQAATVAATDGQAVAARARARALAN